MPETTPALRDEGALHPEIAATAGHLGDELMTLVRLEPAPPDLLLGEPSAGLLDLALFVG